MFNVDKIQNKNRFSAHKVWSLVKTEGLLMLLAIYGWMDKCRV